MHNSNGSNVSIFLVGLGIGALAGILFAPQSGEESRKYLTRRAEDGKDYAQRKARELRDRATDAMDHSKQLVAREVKNISSAVQAGRQAYQANKPNGSVTGSV